MTYSDRINKLADRFEEKLKKYAQDAGTVEVDDSQISQMARVVVNNILENQNIQKLLESMLKEIINSDYKKNVTTEGWLQVGDTFTTNADRVNNKWVINKNKTFIHTEGELRNHPAIKSTWDKMMSNFYAAVFPALEIEFSKLEFNGNKITDNIITVNRCLAQT